MRRWTVAATALGVLAFALLCVYGLRYYERPCVLRVAVSASDPEDFDLMGAAGRLLKKGHRGVRLRVVPVDGVAAASAALDSGQVDVAVVRADIANPTKGETVVLLHKDAALLLAPDGAGIASISDLAGKRIGMLSQRIGDRRVLDEALAQYEVPLDGVKGVPLKLSEVPNALKNKTVDAIFAVGETTAGPVVEAVRAVGRAGNGPPVFLPVAEAPAIAQRMPAFHSVEIVRGTFGGSPPRPADEFNTLGVTYRLVASADLDQGVVATLTRFLLTERLALSQAAPAARRIEAPSTDKGAALPVHPGAAAYIDDDEETFLDRYSDFIYIGAMVLGVFASGITAISSRFSQRNTVRVEDLVGRVLKVLRQVRAATSLAALDPLEDEVDAIMATALDETGLRGMDERRAATLNLALDQVRSAIRDRRETLRRAIPPIAPANDEPRLPPPVEAPALRAVSLYLERPSASEN